MSGSERLIARLEAAECGSRELDGEVALWLGWRRSDSGTHWISPKSPNVAVFDCPGFTRSVDEALTLVATGCVGRIGFGGPGYSFAFVTTPDEWAAGDKQPTVNAATPALSVCIAALARMARP